MDRSPDADALCALMEECSLSEAVRNKMKSQLMDFPHTFQLQDPERLRLRQLQRLKSGLESALSVGYETGMETARARNMLAYILCRLNQPEDALQKLELVLRMEDQEQNLVTLANKAVILWNQMNFSEAEEIVQSLTDLKSQEEFPYLVIQAKAELAFTYTRLGPSFFLQAIAIFEEVIPKAREPEVWLWKFGLGLTRRRLLRAKPQVISAMPSPETAAQLRDLVSLFMDIAEKCRSRSLKAKVYSELATVLFMVSKTPLNKEFYCKAHMNPEQACERALKLDPTDNSVLCKCGRIFRYRRQTEKSCELLEKALTIRPSSTAYHHLGITYKALACNEKHKDTVKIPGYYRQLERLHAGPGQAQSYNSARQQCQKKTTGGPRNNWNASTTWDNYADSGAAAASVSNDVPVTLSLNRDVRVMQRMIKSPPKGVTRFTRDDKFINEALHNFEKAIEFSQGENTRAMYDLAILLKSLGELEGAMKHMQEIMKHEYNLFIADRISIYEQMGLILKEQTESESDEVKKRHLLENSNTLLQMALTSASEIFSRSPGVKEHIGELYNSFPVLLQAVEESNKHPHWKLQEKARLFQLIKDHKQSLELLQEIEQMDPKMSEDPEYLKLCIEDYMAMGQYEKALAFVKLLELTQHSSATMQLFEDEQYVLKIHMEAARQALLNGDSSIAKLRFRPAFLEATNACRYEDSSTEYSSDSSEDSKSDSEAWDVCILHEESEKSRASAVALSTLLEDVFGLKVAITGRDAAPNRFDIDAELRVLKRSTMVIVLAGGKLPKRLRLYVDSIAKQKLTVTLLVDGEHVPHVLKARRHLMCPPELLQNPKLKTEDNAQRTEAEVDTLCKIFSFLVNVDLFKPED